MKSREAYGKLRTCTEKYTFYICMQKRPHRKTRECNGGCSAYLIWCFQHICSLLANSCTAVARKKDSKRHTPHMHIIMKAELLKYSLAAVIFFPPISCLALKPHCIALSRGLLSCWKLLLECRKLYMEVRLAQTLQPLRVWSLGSTKCIKYISQAVQGPAVDIED